MLFMFIFFGDGWWSISFGFGKFLVMGGLFLDFDGFMVSVLFFFWDFIFVLEIILIGWIDVESGDGSWWLIFGSFLFGMNLYV